MGWVSEYCFREKTCPVCGKKFYCYTDTWVYIRKKWKNHTKYFCTWSCLRKYDESKVNNKKKSKTSIASTYGTCVR